VIFWALGAMNQQAKKDVLRRHAEQQGWGPPDGP
jgi:hypothetical protein